MNTIEILVHIYSYLSIYYPDDSLNRKNNVIDQLKRRNDTNYDYFFTGDHSYKKNTELPNTEQMITALPDVRVTKLESDVEFIVLACDGIWNSLSSQEVVNFVKPRIESNKSLSEICEEVYFILFNYSTLAQLIGLYPVITSLGVLCHL